MINHYCFKKIRGEKEMKEQSFEVVSTEELQEVVGGRRRHHYSDWERDYNHVKSFVHGFINGIDG